MVNEGPVTVNLTETIFATINVIATWMAVEQLVSLSGGFVVFPSFTRFMARLIRCWTV
ncbi:hypothetical protein Hanom_Chr02g00155121 [Helianthus anomalus]